MSWNVNRLNPLRNLRRAAILGILGAFLAPVVVTTEALSQGVSSGNAQSPSVLAPLVVRPGAQKDQPTSLFEAPPPVKDESEADWRAANEEAARLGGHVGQVRGRPATPRQ